MKRIISLFFILLAATCYGQEDQPWRSHFSYNNIVDISQSGNRVFAGADNAVFSKSVLTNETKTITSVDGLKTETVTAVYHSPTFNKTLIGNSTGLLLVINPDNTILNVVDIVEETTVQPTQKKINDIFEFEGKAYVSTDFGIVVFNMATMEFGDTYYMGPQGTEIPVLQCTVFNGGIYAATPNNGIRRALYSNLFLNDFNQWSEFASGSWSNIVSFSGRLLAANSIGGVYRLDNGQNTLFSQFQFNVTDMRDANGYLCITSRNRVSVYDSQFVQKAQVNYIPEEIVSFTCATVVTEKLFIGTQAQGVYSATLANPFAFENITPNGPVRSIIYSLEKTANSLWAVHGDYTSEYDPYPLDQFGISKLTGAGWDILPYNEIRQAVGKEVYSISDVIANPNNPEQIYAASYFSGLLKVENDIPTVLYDNTNTGENGLESLNDGNPATVDIRINSLAYDMQGNLWMTNTLIERSIKVMRANGQWNSYSLADISDPLSDNYGKMAIDRNGTKWIPTVASGVIGFNDTMNNKFQVINSVTGNLPLFSRAKAVAIDNNNQLWIGLTLGLRVLSGVDRFSTEDVLTTNPIIIEEDGVAQELMYEQSITDITVDGSNNKWLATGSSGAFLVSPDGQRTLQHFTKTNSPLPSNSILDIEIDSVTGEVFFATDRGMVSYRGTSTAASDNLNNVYVFPNPVRPGYEGDVNISGLIDRANIKITDIEGNLVYETRSEGGTILWDTRAFGKHKVASGVYMIFIVSEDGTQTKVKKVMIVR